MNDVKYPFVSHNSSLPIHIHVHRHGTAYIEWKDNYPYISFRAWLQDNIQNVTAVHLYDKNTWIIDSITSISLPGKLEDIFEIEYDDHISGAGYHILANTQNTQM